MLRIKCPWCGERDQTEFRFGGEVRPARPENPESLSDEEWAEYLFYRDNVKGVHQERWLHRQGCAQWLIATRSTVTHEITQVTTIDDAAAGGSISIAGPNTPGTPTQDGSAAGGTHE